MKLKTTILLILLILVTLVSCKTIRVYFSPRLIAYEKSKSTKSKVVLFYNYEALEGLKIKPKKKQDSFPIELRKFQILLTHSAHLSPFDTYLT